MILNIKTFLENTLKKQMKIYHITCDMIVMDSSKTKKIPSDVYKKIEEEFGKGFFSDSTFSVFFKYKNSDGGGFSASDMKKIRNLLTNTLMFDTVEFSENDLFVVPASEDDESENPKYMFINIKTI